MFLLFIHLSDTLIFLIWIYDKKVSSGTELKRQQGTKNERKKNCTVVFEVSFFMGKPCIHIRQFKFGQRLNFKISKLRAIYTDFNARKVISEVYSSFVLQCTVSMGSNVNTRRMPKPDMGSVFHIKNQWNILDRIE